MQNGCITNQLINESLSVTSNQTCGEASAEAAYTGNIIVGADGFIIDGAATTDLDTFIGKIIEIIIFHFSIKGLKKSLE